MNRSILIMLVALISAGCEAPVSTDNLPDIAVHWAVLDNLQGGADTFKAAFTLTNQGAVPLPNSGWMLYFNFPRMIPPDGVDPAARITHINGDFFKLEPTTSFSQLEQGESITISFDGQNWLINASEAPAGLYFVFTDAQGQPTGPVPVNDVTIEPFTEPEQVNRFAGDVLPLETPQVRFERNRGVPLLPPDTIAHIIPTPAFMESGQGDVTINNAFEIRYVAGLDSEAAFLATTLEPLLGTVLILTEGASPAPNAVTLATGSVTVNGLEKTAGSESYQLLVDADSGIQISGTDRAGVFYGIQSLRALFPVEAYRNVQEAIPVSAVRIEDTPRFGFRGLHLDVGRNFQTKATVLKMLDLMAFYKLNKFHFHITDDEGWRLEMAALPELTEVGSRRGHTLDESDHLYPSFGSGPDPNPAVSHGSGYYTRADFIEILRYAGARHIEVIPEIDMPGHARAAIKAMDARYARLTAAGQTTDAESLLLSESAFLLSEAGDMSEYLSVQMWRDNVVNVCQASTYRFLETVVDEIQSMYDEAGVPLTTIHTGGDEVPHGAWEQSPTCTRLIQEQEDLHSVHDLTRYFLRNFSRILNDRGLITGGWEEIALMPVEQNGQTVHVPNPEFLESRFRMNVWNNVWGWGSEANAYKLANAGYEVVLSNATNLYFDLAYNKDPEEPGYYWANFVNTRTAFEFIPFNFYQNATVDRMGHAIDPATYAGHERLTDAGRQNILGIQGQLWGENAKGPERLEYMAFPRILALSERAWTAQPAWAVSEDDIERNQELTESWSRFAHTTGRRELPRLDYLDGGVEYRIPLPGAIIEHGMLNANIAFPGLVVRYTTDGTEPTTSSTLYTEPVAVQGTVKLKAFDTRGRSSRTSVIE